MQKTTILTALISLLFLTITIAFAQDDGKEQPPKNLNEAFQQLKDKSANYEQYQVVANTRLDAFWKQITDSLTAKESTYQNARGDISELNNTIREMEITMAEKDKQVANSQYLVEHLKVLGISVSKSGYVYFNFFIILALAAVIGIGFGRFKANESATTESKKAAENAEAELEEYKKKSKDKEMKLRRELQTEINRNEDLGKEIIQLKKRKAAQ